MPRGKEDDKSPLVGFGFGFNLLRADCLQFKFTEECIEI